MECKSVKGRKKDRKRSRHIRRQKKQKGQGKEKDSFTVKQCYLKNVINWIILIVSEKVFTLICLSYVTFKILLDQKELNSDNIIILGYLWCSEKCLHPIVM